MLARALALLLTLLIGAPALALDASRMPLIGLGPGFSGEGGGLDVTAPGAQPYALAERAADEVSVMGFIPKALRPAIRNYTSTADLTPYIRKALATGKSPRFPSGRYPVCDSLPLASGQAMLADNVTAAYLWVGSCFNMSATAVVPVAVGDSSGWDGLGIRFDQSGATSRTTLKRYPWALDLANATRFKIGRLRLSGAWNGINGYQPNVTGPNPGGLDAKLIEIGAFNKGMILDGLSDFAHLGVVHFWPFDFAGSPTLMAIYLDGSTIGAEFGRIDGLDAQTINTFGPSIVGNANGNDGPARQVGLMQLDGDHSNFINQAGDWQIGLLSSTKGGSLSEPVVSSASGTVLINSFRTWGAQLGSYLKVTGGVVNVMGGDLEQLANYPAAEVTGGTLIMQNVSLAPLANQPRTAPFLWANGGILIARDNVATTPGSASLITVSTDLPDNAIVGNAMRGWGISLPSGSLSGAYADNLAAASPYVAGVAVGREYARRLTGTLDGSGEAIVPHGVPTAQGATPAERIFSFTATRISGGGIRVSYPASTGTAWDGTSISLKGGGVGLAGAPYEVTVRYR